jgi:hypothetical protein
MDRWYDGLKRDTRATTESESGLSLLAEPPGQVR